MVSDQEIANCVESLLRQSDPTTTAAATLNVNGVVQQLEAKLGLDLSHKVGFIRDHVNSLLLPRLPPNPKDHFALLDHNNHLFFHQQQQQQQQQYRQLLLQAQHYPIQQSPFTHLPQHHELAFQCSPPALAIQQQQQQQGVTVAAVVKNQEAGGHFAPGPTTPAAPKASGQIGVKRKGGSGGLSKVCGVSPELQAIVGEAEMPRTQIVKQLWAYIRKNNLQDPNNKRNIICNDELRLVFETDSTDMFKMNKLLSKHIVRLEPAKGSAPDSKRSKAADAPPASEPDTGDCPLAISDDLAKFFGTEEKEMLHSEALKRVWDYIKVNQLEDPVNTMMVLCDTKLQQLFGCESLAALGVSEMVSRHLVKQF